MKTNTVTRWVRTRHRDIWVMYSTGEGWLAIDYSNDRVTERYRTKKELCADLDEGKCVWHTGKQ